VYQCSHLASSISAHAVSRGMVRWSLQGKEEEVFEICHVDESDDKEMLEF
jgi:hypothetical protein